MNLELPESIAAYFAADELSSEAVARTVSRGTPS
jgi:hypothetical protein